MGAALSAVTAGDACDPAQAQACPGVSADVLADQSQVDGLLESLGF
jgi:hypothetical protein